MNGAGSDCSGAPTDASPAKREKEEEGKGKAADVGEECEDIACKTSKLVADTFSSIVGAMRELQGIKAATKIDLTNLVPWESALPECCTLPRKSYLMQAKKTDSSTWGQEWISNNLGALPEEMPGEWIKVDVEELVMDVNYLRKVPAWIGDLMHIKTLELGASQPRTDWFWDQNSIDKLPDLGKMSALTSLSIPQFPNLRQLPVGLSEFKALIRLEITSCGALTELPQIAGLRAPRTLTLALNEHRHSGGSASKKIPECIGDLAALETLVISSTSLYHVPASIGKLQALTFLEISHCQCLKKLPMAMAKLKALKSLKFITCVNLKELPDKVVAGWAGLQILHLKGCTPVIKDVSKALSQKHCELLGAHSVDFEPGGAQDRDCHQQSK